MNIQDFVKSVETLNPALADCRKHIAAFGESAKATEEKQKKLAESQKQVTASLQQMKAGFQQMGNAVKESVTSLLSFNGVVGMLGLGIGGKLVDATLHYNRTLFELSQQAKVSGRSFSNMKLAVDEISKSTALAEDHAAQFFKELSDGAQGISITTKMSKELAVAFSTAYGPSLEQMRRGVKDLNSAQKEMPGTFRLITGSMSLKSYKEFIEQQVLLGEVSVETAENLLRVKRAHELGSGAIDQETKDLQALEKVKEEFEKGLRQFILSVGKPLADILKNFGSTVKPVFEYINKFLKDEKTQQFIKLLMKGTAVAVGAKMIGSVLGGAGSAMGGAAGLLGIKKKQDVNIDTISGMPAAGVMAGGRGGSLGDVASSAGVLSQLKSTIAGIPQRIAPAIMAYGAVSMAGSYMREKHGDEEDKTGGRDANIRALENIGKAGAIGYGAAGPQGAAVATTFMLFGELGNKLSQLIPATDYAGDAMFTFTDNLQMGWEWLKDKTSGKTSGTTTSERLARETSQRADYTEINKQNAEKLLAGLSDVEKSVMNISSGSKEEQTNELINVLKKQHEEKFGKERAFVLSGGGREEKSSIGGKLIKDILGGKQEELAAEKKKQAEISSLQFLKAQEQSRAYILQYVSSTIERNRAELDLSMKYGDSLGNILDRTKEITESYDKQKTIVEAQLAGQTIKLQAAQKELRLAEQIEVAERELAKKRGEGLPEQSKAIEDRLNAESMVNQILANQEKLQTSLKQITLQRKDAELGIAPQIEAEVQARKTLIDFEVKYTGNLEKVNKLIEKNIAAYDLEAKQYKQKISRLEIEIALLSKQADKQKEIQQISAEIERTQSLLVGVLSKQNDQYEYGKAALNAQRSVIDAEMALGEANLELNKAINGGLGATLAIRADLYEQASKGIEIQKQEIAYLEQIKAKRQADKNQQGVLDVEKQIREEKLKQVQYIQKQVELTKSLRDGYLDALASFQQVEGTFSKIIMTRESGLGEAMRKGMAAQGFSAGALGGGLSGPIFKRNPDGSITTPSSETLHNVWKTMEKNYDPNRPNVRGVESVGAGVLSEKGLETQFAPGKLGPQSPNYGEVNKSGNVVDISPNKIFKQTNAQTVPGDFTSESGGRTSLTVQPEGKVSDRDKKEEDKAKKNSSAVESSMKEANGPIVDLLEKILKVLEIGSSGATGATGAKGAIGEKTVSDLKKELEDASKGMSASSDSIRKIEEEIEKEEIRKSKFTISENLAKDLKESSRLSKEAKTPDERSAFTKVHGALKKYEDQFIAGQRATSENLGDLNKQLDEAKKNMQSYSEKVNKTKEELGKKESKAAAEAMAKPIKEAVDSIKDLKNSIDTSSEKGKEYAKQYREIIANDAMARDDIHSKYDETVSKLGTIIDTSGVGKKGVGVRIDQTKLAKKEEAGRTRDRELEFQDKRAQERSDKLAKDFKKTVQDQTTTQQTAAEKREMDYKTGVQKATEPTGVAGPAGTTGPVVKREISQQEAETEEADLQEKYKPKKIDMEKYKPQEYLKESISGFLERKQKQIEKDEADYRNLGVQKEMINREKLLDPARNEVTKIGPEEAGRNNFDSYVKNALNYGAAMNTPIAGGESLASLPMGEDNERRRIAEDQLKETEESNKHLQTVAENTVPKNEEVGKGSGGLNLPEARMQSGGRVGGSGSGDKVPAMLEPGEFVVNKNAASQFGGLLHAINVKKYAEGGSVGSPSISGGTMGGPKINFNIRGDSAKSILSEANKDLASALNDMMGGLNASARYYDLPKSG